MIRAAVQGHGAIDPALRLAQVMGRVEQAVQLIGGQLGADLGVGAEHGAQVCTLLHRLLAALLDQISRRDANGATWTFLALHGFA